jgi:signal transduction histidine kinase
VILQTRPSILEAGGEDGVFRWHAVAGPFAPNLWDTMPRNASPCGTDLTHDAVLLFDEPERVFPVLRRVEPRIYEALLAPWHVNGEQVGTLWALQHAPGGRFDAEDARLLQSVSRFASAAHQMTATLDAQEARSNKLERRVKERMQALRESEEQYRALFDSIDEGFVVADVLYDVQGRPFDVLVLETNPSFDRMMRVTNPVGMRALEIFPDAENYWFTAYGRVVATGEAQRAEYYLAPLDRWFEVYISRVGGEGSRHIAIVFSDVTVRKRAEERLRASEASLQRRVGEATAELRALSRRLLTVQEEERRHLARELHDEIGQVLTGLSFQIAAARGKQGKAALAEAGTTVQALTEQVRQLSMDLRPAVLDGLGLLPALQWFAERYQTRTGITVDLRHDGLDGRFPPEIEIGAYRVVQEALTNSARHSRIDAVAVQLFADDGTLTVVIRDAGRGFDPLVMSNTSGIGGMRERVELLGGMLEIETAPGRGVIVTAEIPLDGRDGATQTAKSPPETES